MHALPSEEVDAPEQVFLEEWSLATGTLEQHERSVSHTERNSDDQREGHE